MVPEDPLLAQFWGAALRGIQGPGAVVAHVRATLAHCVPLGISRLEILLLRWRVLTTALRQG